MFILNKCKPCRCTLKHLTTLRKILLKVETQWYCQVASKDKKLDWCTYSEYQQSVILQTLNKYLTANMTRSYLSARKLQSIKDYLKPRLVLTDVNQLIDVEGIGLISAHQICDNILREVNNEPRDDRLKIGSIVTPALPQVIKQKLETAVGLNVGFSGISWARLHCKNHSLLDWNYYDLENIINKKYDLYDLFHIAMDLRERIPDADVYVIENFNWSNIANTKVSVSLQMMRSQLVTAILSIFNTHSVYHTDENRLPELDSRVYFLKHRVYARMFRTVIGSECVSAYSIIEKIFQMQPDERYCSVSVDGILQNYYHSLNGPVQDNMNHSLMVVIAFVNLVVLGRQQSIKAVLSSKIKIM